MRFRPSLTESCGKLLSNASCGQPVHAGSFIRKREIVLESELRDEPEELARIFVHELFHFVWVRLGNPRRESYERMISNEIVRRARGELGWSAQERKSRLNSALINAAWKAYVCESFCDTAAFLYSGCNSHEEFTLAERWRQKRVRWFDESVGRRMLSI